MNKYEHRLPDTPQCAFYTVLSTAVRNDSAGHSLMPAPRPQTERRFISSARVFSNGNYEAFDLSYWRIDRMGQLVGALLELFGAPKRCNDRENKDVVFFEKKTASAEFGDCLPLNPDDARLITELPDPICVFLEYICESCKRKSSHTRYFARSKNDPCDNCARESASETKLLNPVTVGMHSFLSPRLSNLFFFN